MSLYFKKFCFSWSKRILTIFFKWNYFSVVLFLHCLNFFFIKMNIENFFIIGDRTSKISVPLTEKWFILNKWRKKPLSFWRKKDLYSTNDGSSIFCCCFNSMGKMKYLSQVSQIQREQWLINHNPNWNSILASLFFCWFPLNEMMDQLKKAKQVLIQTIEFVCFEFLNVNTRIFHCMEMSTALLKSCKFFEF